MVSFSPRLLYSRYQLLYDAGWAPRDPLGPWKKDTIFLPFLESNHDPPAVQRARHKLIHWRLIAWIWDKEGEGRCSPHLGMCRSFVNLWPVKIWSTWRAGLLCTRGGKGRTFALVCQPIRYRHQRTRDSLLAWRWDISQAKNYQINLYVNSAMGPWRRIADAPKNEHALIMKPVFTNP